MGLYFIYSCYSAGELVKDNVVGSPVKKYKLPWYHWIALIFLILSSLWIFIFVNNLGDYMISAAVCEDYFQTKSGTCGAVCNTVVYHLGSVALASVVLLPTSLIRFIYAPIYDLITKSGNEAGKANFLQKCLSITCICIKWPYKKWVMRTDEHGFPMGYIASCNFCPATKEAFYLKEAYSETLGDIGLITFIYRFTGVIAIACLNTFIASLVFTYLPYYQSRLSNPIVPTIVGYFLSRLSS